MFELFAQVDERARELDQAFEKCVIFIAALQPEIFEDIVRFVILAEIEAREVALIARIERERGICAELLDEGGNAVALFHRAGKAAKLFCPPS